MVIASATKTLSEPSLLRFAYNSKRSALWAQMCRMTVPGQSVLDAGCGLGQWVWFLNHQGYRATGLDYSEKMIRFLGNRFPDFHWSVGRIQDVPYKDSEFDHLISLGVIEHDPAGPGKALVEFHRIIKKGGYIFVQVPIDSPHQRTSMEVQFPANLEGAVFFEYFFTQGDLKTIVTQHGFRVISILPVYKNYAVLYPEQYIRNSRNPQFPNNLRARILNILASLSKNSYHLLLLVAQKI